MSYEPVRLVHRQTTVQALAYDGTDERRNAIIAWSQGKCFTTNGEQTEFWCDSPEGRRRIHAGMVVIHGVMGEWYPTAAATVAVNYREPTTDYGSDHSLTDDQIRQIRTTAHATADPERLRELVDQIAAAALKRAG